MGMDESIVQLRSLDDLKKVLFLQKSITTKAKNELVAVAGDGSLEPDADPSVEAARFLAEERKILEKYAKYPTLTEFQLMPNSYDGYKWGATFGVTLLVGELIFEQLKTSHPHFGPVIRQLVVLFLSELDHPQHEYLIEPLEKHLRYKVTSELGTEVPEAQQKAFVRDLVNQFADTLVALCDSYGIVKVKKGGVVITPLGKRVLLHLIDAAKWVEDMTTAHAKFQNSKPHFSMT
jgi:hypothetical protein